MILDSERSEECIDFTIIIVFFIIVSLPMPSLFRAVKMLTFSTLACFLEGKEIQLVFEKVKRKNAPEKASRKASRKNLPTKLRRNGDFNANPVID